MTIVWYSEMILPPDTALADLNRDGYCVVENVLDSETVASFRAILNVIAEAELASETSWFSHGNQRIFSLLNKHTLFLELIDHPLAIAFAQSLLGEYPLLSSITCNITVPGNSRQHLHTDQGYIPPPWPRCEATNLVWTIDPFTRRNGATRVVPGSHRCAEQPPDSLCASIEAPAGSLICLDGRVWHGTGANFSNGEKRRGIFAYYCRPYLRQQENFARSLPRETLLALNAPQRSLLGFDIWQGLGAVKGLPVSWMDGRERIGPTNADGIFDAWEDAK